MISRFRGLCCVLAIALCSSCGDTPEPVVIEPAAQPAAMRPMVRVNLDLSAVRETMPSAAKVYVFVREPGNRMPIGVASYTVGDAPTSLAFAADEPLDTVEVVARVSPSGKVEQQPEDAQAIVMASVGHPPATVHLKPLATSGTAVSAPSELAISLSAPGSESLGGDTTVFLIARVPGQAMPVAVKRLTLKELPGEFTLSDADSMMPSRTISSVGAVQVTAHTSLSGDVSRTPDDWSGIGKPVAGEAASFKLTLKPPQ